MEKKFDTYIPTTGRWSLGCTIGFIMYKIVHVKVISSLGWWLINNMINRIV
ncbi:hypothetical protein ABFP89_17040 [Clostridioides difficile]|uniref:hypothetical protein n=1 Tax=Clostridioides difficile TaxID=1496 RepID=UPI00038CB80F|nr:hypothetical protein [Clostridioides difficile]EQJ66452.1 hypothetical protein QU3_3216 [Clostridioides difficile P42]EIS9212223.1 hypothetical protein [Clostridioides difficile]EIS9641685.1 hypothetical protein [Clostridioides difficile]EIS9763139.1 hypothetical protein [Clostridioides difficile]EQK85458.1 hypothetical protein QSM_3208 [Clostridioides difficile P30]